MTRTRPRATATPAPLRRIPSQEWWRTEGGFFLLTEAHRADEGPKAADFLETVLGLSPPARVLDLGCGWGRLSIELARRGYGVVGLDCSRVIRLGKLLAHQAGTSVDWVRGDMRRWTAPPRFDLAVLWGMSFGYFDDEQNQEVLQRVASSLVPGGHLVLDLHHREWYLRNYLGEHVELVQRKVSHDEASFDHAAGRLNILSTVADGQGKVLGRQWHSFREYTVEEVRERTERVGLEVVSVHSGMRTAPGPPRPSESSWQLIARRPFVGVRGSPRKLPPPRPSRDRSPSPRAVGRGRA